jgi:hypothetical protein
MLIDRQPVANGSALVASISSPPRQNEIWNAGNRRLE